jgi:hypothetical protein
LARVPIGVDPAVVLKRSTGAARSRTFKQRVKVWRQCCRWLRRSLGISWPGCTGHLVQYREERASECGRAVPRSLIAAHAFLEDCGAVDEVNRYSRGRFLGRTVDSLTVELSAVSPPARRAPPVRITMVVAMELTVDNEAALLFMRFCCGFELRKVWAVFRFDDHLGMNPQPLVPFAARPERWAAEDQGQWRGPARYVVAILCGARGRYRGHRGTDGMACYSEGGAIRVFTGLLFASVDDGLAKLLWKTRGVRGGLGPWAPVCDDYGDRATRTGVGLWRSYCNRLRARRFSGLNTRSTRIWTAGKPSAQSLRRFETTGTLAGSDTYVMNAMDIVFVIQERVAEVKRAVHGRFDVAEVLWSFEGYLVESRADAGLAAWWRDAHDMVAILP